MTEPYVVVVGMDFSELADKALSEAFELTAFRDNAEIHVVSIVSPPTPVPNIDASLGGVGYVAASEPDPLDGQVEHLRAHVQAQLEAFVARVAERGGKVSGRVVSHVRVDTPALGLAQLASDLKAHLIVVGTHGRRGLARLLMGSVAETTLRYARCPVLVIPSNDEPVEVKIEPPCPDCLLARAVPGSQELLVRPAPRAPRPPPHLSPERAQRRGHELPPSSEVTGARAVPTRYATMTLSLGGMLRSHALDSTQHAPPAAGTPARRRHAPLPCSNSNLESGAEGRLTRRCLCASANALRSRLNAEFAAALAHEIRNPLNGAQLHLALLERAIKRNASQPEMLEASQVVTQQLKRLAELVTEFLERAQSSAPTVVETTL